MSSAIATTNASMAKSIPFSNANLYAQLLLSGKNKLKVLYLFIHRCCSRFTYLGAWFLVLNCKHYKMRLF